MSELSFEQIKTAHKGAHNIMQRWNATEAQCLSVLLVMPDDLIKGAVDEQELAELSYRISYVLNIYVVCRTLFSNINNQDQLVNLKNSFFGGRTPLDVMTAGDVESIKRVAEYFLSLLNYGEFVM